MPHINIEYTANLTEAFDATAALRAANAAIVGSGLFDEELSVKSRAILLQDFRVGNFEDGEAFVHARIHLMAGRSIEQRKQLGAAVVAAIGEAVKPTAGLRVQITAELNEMLAETYQKLVIG
ncbi:5-carboxymethyl-2-hydroxymuconate Delta-isomerase [Uliginosibacterium sp. H3]|uniref:5-carboxymethyl-2-hydroxymuconate Delta-isomerase n=1 Tax=Uliginosibacterium silvisoli TaxID=3114758 RepID=A0ABU6JYB5_9RHOO|nr:5-carboxymethyl-2-hydroxymuconate Delta-isomerase [Uliginosibacterium sp. H3]